MKCARFSCSCLVDSARAVEADGKVYCSETCAKECTDEKCVCKPCDCEKAE